MKKSVHVKSSSQPQTKRNSNEPLKPWMIYDDSMADKQCEAYTTWLNYIVKPQEDNMQDSREIKSENSICETANHPTLNSLLIERRRVQASQKALTFYHGSEMKSTRNVLEREICTNRLSMRSDHDVLANVNLKSQMISLLMSYSTPWLKLGLETIFGETITLDIVTKSMKKNSEIRKSLGIASPKGKMVRSTYAFIVS
jgi:hypothetical protein